MDRGLWDLCTLQRKTKQSQPCQQFYVGHYVARWCFELNANISAIVLIQIVKLRPCDKITKISRIILWAPWLFPSEFHGNLSLCKIFQLVIIANKLID